MTPKPGDFGVVTGSLADAWRTRNFGAALIELVTRGRGYHALIATSDTEALGAGDGVFSGQPNSIWDKKTRETLQACWPTLQHGTGGSKAIAKMQRTIGVHDDGYFGPNTRKGLQKWLGVKVDGFPGYITCKALQRAHNDGRI